MWKNSLKSLFNFLIECKKLVSLYIQRYFLGACCNGSKAVFNKSEPISVNINSGEDDNVEPLTGNDVGIK